MQLNTKTDGNNEQVRVFLILVSRCDPFRVAGAPEGSSLAAAGPDNVRPP